MQLGRQKCHVVAGTGVMSTDAGGVEPERPARAFQSRRHWLSNDRLHQQHLFRKKKHIITSQRPQVRQLSYYR